MPEKRLTHLDERGHAHMVDVSPKAPTARRAVAEATVRMDASTLDRVRRGSIEKGDVLAVVRVAGIQGAKRTSDLVPLCHPIRLDHVGVDVDTEAGDRARIRVEARAFDRTGVEMEALTGAAAAALALIDMIKGVDRGAYVEGLRLLSKEGGRSGTWSRPDPASA